MVPYIRKTFRKHYKRGFKYIAAQQGYVLDKKLNYYLGKLSKNALPIDDELYTRYNKTDRVYNLVYKYAMECTEDEVMEGVEALFHNLNSLQSRSGNQLPFTSINYGTCTLIEGRMFTKAMLEGSIEGTGRLHKTPTFPCGIFTVKEGINKHKGDPNYDLFKLALKSTSLRLYPKIIGT